VLGEWSARNSKFDVVLGDQDDVVSRIVVVTVPGLGRLIDSTHCRIAGLLLKEDEVEYE
jgi:hypothetical protein